MDVQGNLFFADKGNHAVRRIDVLTGTITTVAGNGTIGSNGSGDDGPATSARLNYPNGVAVDVGGNLYIVDQGRIRKVDTNGIISTVAGNDGFAYGQGDGGLATNASLHSPKAVAVDAAGNVYIADTYVSLIRRVDVNGVITTVAGRPGDGPLGDGGPR